MHTQTEYNAAPNYFNKVLTLCQNQKLSMFINYIVKVIGLRQVNIYMQLIGLNPIFEMNALF